MTKVQEGASLQLGRGFRILAVSKKSLTLLEMHCTKTDEVPVNVDLSPGVPAVAEKTYGTMLYPQSRNTTTSN